MNEPSNEIKLLEYRIKELQQILEKVEEQLEEIMNINTALADYAKLSADDEILFPIATGIFGKAKLSGDKILRMNVGSSIMVEKSVDEAIALMQKQHQEIESYRDELLVQMKSMIARYEELQ